MPAHQSHARLLEGVGVRVVVPVVGRLAHPLCGRPQGRLHVDLAPELAGTAGLGQGVGGADEELGRGAAVEGALAAHQARLDRDDPQPGRAELAGHVLAARADPEHDDVDDTVRRAHLDRCRARAKQKSPYAPMPRASAPSRNGPKGCCSTFCSATSRPPDFLAECVTEA